MTTQLSRSIRIALATWAMVSAVGIALAPSTATAQEESFGLEETTKPSTDPNLLKGLTQGHSEVEVGLCYVSDDSFRFGRYNGLQDQGTSLVLNLDYRQRDRYDSDSAHYLILKASNLGLDSRAASVAFGTQGKYAVRLDYDQIPALLSDSTRTIFDGAGGTRLTLPSNWVGAGTTAGMTQLLPSLKDVAIESERHRSGVAASGVLSSNWDFSTQYRHETKDGLKTLGAVFGNSGGNPRSVLVPEPIDYTTEQLDAALRYGDKTKQVQLSYYLSLFGNANSALVWQNPYTTINGWSAGSGFPSGTGQLSLPPDNQFHQLSLDGAYNLSAHTRLSASLSRGHMTQDDKFLPYTDIAALDASITQPLPRDSLDGRIDTSVANLRITSRPSTRFHWTASYRYDDRDNKTPRDEYVYIGGDSQTQNTGAASDRRRYNEPYSYQDQQYKFDAGYRIASHGELSAGAEHRRTDRTYSEREEARENLFHLSYNAEFSDRLGGHLRLSHAERHGSTYVGNEPLHTGFAPAYVATVPGDFENHPGLRKYFLADRGRDQLSVFISFTPTQSWAFSAAFDHAHDDYAKSELGLTASKLQTYTLDAVYAPSPLWSTYGFYTYEKLASDQDGHSFSGGAAQIPQAADPNRDWSADHRDHVDTAGIGLKRKFPERRLELGLDALYSRTRSDLFVAVGPGLTAAPLPRNGTRLNSLSAYATYQWRDDLTLRLRGWHERYTSSDWALDGIAPNTLANVITLGEDSPDYSTNVVTLSFVYLF